MQFALTLQIKIAPWNSHILIWREPFDWLKTTYLPHQSYSEIQQASPHWLSHSQHRHEVRSTHPINNQKLFQRLYRHNDSSQDQNHCRFRQNISALEGQSCRIRHPIETKVTKRNILWNVSKVTQISSKLGMILFKFSMIFFF